MASRNPQESAQTYQLEGDGAGPRPLASKPVAAVAATAVQATATREWRVDRIQALTAELSVRWFELAARIAIFIIYFWFGFLKLISLSPATPLASALVQHTIGMSYFTTSFKALAIFEMALGVLFLIPALTWIATVLLVVHLGIVSSPLVLVANVAWIHPLVPTLEGQYIIKDVAILALAIGVIAHRRLAAR